MNNWIVGDIILLEVNQMEKKLTIDDAVIWAFYHKLKLEQNRTLSIRELRTYAKAVTELADEVFGYKAKFVINKDELKHFVCSQNDIIKYDPNTKEFKLRSFVSAKLLMKSRPQGEEFSIELEHALSDTQIAKDVFCTQKEIEK